MINFLFYCTVIHILCYETDNMLSTKAVYGWRRWCEVRICGQTAAGSGEAADCPRVLHHPPATRRQTVLRPDILTYGHQTS